MPRVQPKPYNHLYDLMHGEGRAIHPPDAYLPALQVMISARRSVEAFPYYEPETWGKIVSRVNGANQGALYAQESGNILGCIKISKPEGHTWSRTRCCYWPGMPDKKPGSLRG